ncbi:MAG: helix-turn-helix domain-containing protein [Alphaproteobacteria bacterium]
MKMQEQNIATSYSTILGQMIRQLRETKQVEQGRLAEYLGVSVMTVSRIESGDTVLDVPQMEKVANFFGYNPVDFFRDSLKIKQKAETQNFKVFQNKKEVNSHPDLAILSIAAIVGLVAGILLSRK